MKLIFQPTTEAMNWEINPEEIEKLKEDLEELGQIDIKFYRSKLSLISKSYPYVKHAEPSEPPKSNHVQIVLNNKAIAEFYSRFIGFTGVLLEENIPEDLREKVEDILGKHKYYTGESSWKYFPLTPLSYIMLIGALYMMACATIALLSSEPSLSTREILTPLLSVIAAVSLTYMYRVIFP